MQRRLAVKSTLWNFSPKLGEDRWSLASAWPYPSESALLSTSSVAYRPPATAIYGFFDTQSSLSHSRLFPAKFEPLKLSVRFGEDTMSAAVPTKLPAAWNWLAAIQLNLITREETCYTVKRDKHHHSSNMRIHASVTSLIVAWTKSEKRFNGKTAELGSGIHYRRIRSLDWAHSPITYWLNRCRLMSVFWSTSDVPLQRSSVIYPLACSCRFPP